MSILIPSVTNEISIFIIEPPMVLTLTGVRLAHKYKIVHKVLSLFTYDLSLSLDHSGDLVIACHYCPIITSYACFQKLTLE